MRFLPQQTQQQTDQQSKLSSTPKQSSFQSVRQASGVLIGSILAAYCGMLLLSGLARASAPPASPQRTAHTTIPISETVASGPIFLPLLQAAVPQAQPTATATSTPPPSPTPAPQARREWDGRLDQRGTSLTEAAVGPGQGYWRLVRAVWFNEQEAQGRHHIFVDVLDADGKRIPGVPVRIYWNGGETTVTTQQKPGEPYAADFGMFAVAPSYGARPNDGSPADELWGMGLGSIEQPAYAIHTAYGFTWQWTTAPSAQVTATPTATPTSAPVITTPTPGSSPTPTAMPAATPTATATPGSAYLFNRAQLVRCDPNAGITYVQGKVRLNGQPANGYRVVFSWTPDGQIVAGITSGPHEGYIGWDPGYYSHIIQAYGPRAGDWWFWIVDGAGTRISEMAHVRTDATAGEGKCQQAVIDFDSQ